MSELSMLSGFYRNYSRHLLIAVAVSFPFLFLEANAIPNNNEIETWLPDRSEVRDVYNRFKADFGDEEIILIGLNRDVEESGLSEALALRIEQLPGIRVCWSPKRMSGEMEKLGVDSDTARGRMHGLCLSNDEEVVALMAVLSSEGTDDRGGVISDVRRILDYCQIEESDYLLAGHPVVITEMDRLGNKEETTKFFMLTLAVSAVLLYATLRNWALSLSLLGVTLWGIQFTTAMVKWCGGEANFILSALCVMVMVFTLAVSIHVVGYFRHARGEDRLGEALRMAWKPCFLAVLTTAIGLASLTISEMGPVRQFGWSASLGSVVSLLVGYGLTPAILTLIPINLTQQASDEQRLARLAFGIVGRSPWVVSACALLAVVVGWGLMSINSRIEPLDFLPREGKVHSDIITIEDKLASASTIEAVVDFGGTDLAFGDKLTYVRDLTRKYQENPHVGYALSLSTLFPDRLPSDAIELMGLLEEARSRNGESDLIADGDRLWRISARLVGHVDHSGEEVAEQLAALSTDGIPVHFTGMEVLLEHAQGRIFQGFWESFSTAFLIISAIMILSLGSIRAGLVAMVPNLFPIVLVFGTMGWMNIPVDIGTMMTGSIALGLAVDGTFHYLVRYNESLKRGESSSRSARVALLMTGGSIFNAAMITALGMLALVVSSFGPTARFGIVMCTLMTTAIVGDLVLLPALLSLRSEDRVKRRQLLKLSELRDRDEALKISLQSRRKAS